MESNKNYKVLKDFMFEDIDLVADTVLSSEFFDNNEDVIRAQVEEGNIEEVGQSEEYTGPLAKYKITGEAIYVDEHGTRAGLLEIDSIQVLPVKIGEQFVKDGVAEEVVEKDVDQEDKLTAIPKVKILEGKKIIAEYPRTINEKTYHHVRLEDGTTQDLTDEEYGVKVVVKENDGE